MTVVDSADMRLGDLFSEVRPTRGFEEIAMQIQSAVYAGKLNVGDRLPNERDLGEIFGVSRATLREALRLLEALGVIEVRRGATGGAFIVEPAPERAGLLLGSFIHFRHATSEDLNEFRETFEAETASWAAQRATSEECQDLLALVDQIRQIRDAGSWEAFVDLDLKFHFKIAQMSKNKIRIAIMQGIHEVFRKSSLAIAQADSPLWRRQQEAEISAVAQAIVEHRPDDARRLMRSHVASNVTQADADTSTGLSRGS
jgi:DNA-binding FadR family transcriptional regulator